ncbi:beta-1,3-galactosyltransferase GALT1-like [Dendrobium catenatum]|uniref:Beta-1,3-galactosyltransferase 15 n=1 Tax=Dendrobium catenatum TaxID=906689 RepID=A0A2I0XBL5_9ASPA|nr:beta-1,3-galactosyltransferase GALT1-like [Dendrobium catenatum]XP_020703115.1 beta-1,3-galactosyltransferase GALT1-like [Dendrobium catenatum]PKU85295.1 Beta-1,3-galactosyltransferase 15 [Dendrobium catenatum]
MKKCFRGLIILTSFFAIFTFLLLRYVIVKNPLVEISFPSPYHRNNSEHLYWMTGGGNVLVSQNPKNESEVVSTGSLMSQLSIPHNLSNEEEVSLQTWKHMAHLVNQSKGLPQAVEAVKEAVTAWEDLRGSIEDEKLERSGNRSKSKGRKEQQCPYFIIRMNVSEISNSDFRLRIPCGLVQGSSLTIIGTPDGILGNFKIDLLGTAIPGEQDPPIILHYNVRLHGDKITEDPVIVQNTWTSAHDWGLEERCPFPDTENNQKVDDLHQCSKAVGEDDEHIFASKISSNSSAVNPSKKKVVKPRRYFPFKQGYLAVSTLRIGAEGIQMSVNGKHITSFAFRETLEPWLVNEARISGDIKLLSILASGLPTSEDFEHVADLESLKSVILPIHKGIDLFIGVFSTANNFMRRMAVRRTWMQYDAVRSRAVAVRFFVGLHKNQLVNEQLWNEARTYGDIQLMPFVDYYSLITLKTVAICLYGINIVSAKYVMKTDDDAFVRIDEVLSSLNSTNVTRGLLYGKINNDDQPNRDPDSKWYISPEEWPGQTYPPWAHGPGYVVSRDIAKAVYKQHKKGRLKMFKLEDVAMGIWTNNMKKRGMDIKYVNDGRILIEGCETGYVVAHYQQPREMLCLWQKLQETNRASCCGE